MTTSRTPKKARWCEPFLKTLSVYGNVSRAADDAQISRNTAYSYRAQHEEFAKAWDEALAIGTAALEDEARRRAFEGVEHTRNIYTAKGELFATEIEIKYSDTLLIFLLKAHKPAVYRETIRQEHANADGTPLTVQILRGVSMDDL